MEEKWILTSLDNRFNLIWNNQEILLFRDQRNKTYMCILIWLFFMFSLRHTTLHVCSNVTLPKPWIFYFKSMWWDYSEINLVWGENSFLKNIENPEVFRRVNIQEVFLPREKNSNRRWWQLTFQVISCLFYWHGIWPPALPNTQGCWARPLSHEALASWLKIMTPAWYQAAGAFNSCWRRLWSFLINYIILEQCTGYF